MLKPLFNSKFIALLLCLAITIQFGCKKTDDVAIDTTPVLEPPVPANDATKVTATITGTVLDENNAPVANAFVKADAANTTTDAMGNFVFKNISISAANGFVTVVKPGYFKGIRSFVTDAGKNNYVKIQLIKQTLTATLTAASGGVVSVASGATINFPANAFVTAGGAAYSGSVKVFAAYIDPTAANLPLVVPGDLRGINSANGEYLLKSYGMVGAEFTDNSGNALKIAPGKTAAISFPVPAAMQATAPATIPLWHFDEATARWKEEGTATKNGNSYTAQVSKFSFWNVDVPANFIKLDLRLVNNANNLPLANTMVKITSLATNTYAYDFTNDSGFVSGFVPKNENLKLEVIAGAACNAAAAAYTQNIGPYSANTSLGNINVTLPANSYITFTGSVKNCSNQAVTNGYVSITIAGGGNVIAYTNATGAVNVTVLTCNTNAAYTYNAVDLSTGNYSTPANGTATTNSVNLTTIAACGNTINTNGVYIAGDIDNNAVVWKDGVPTFLTNNPINSSKYTYARKVVVYNNDVYVMGEEQDSGGYVRSVKLWKNGVVTTMPSTSTKVEGNGLDVYNGDVYICGEEHVSGGSNPVVWKNGVASTLPKGSFTGVAPYDIKVFNGDVYACGWGTGNGVTSKGVYWKNGVLNILPNAGSTSYANSLFITGNGDLYIGGSDSLDVVYWKNNVKTRLRLAANIYSWAGISSIFVDNTDVYVAGKSYTQTGVLNAAYCKNGNVISLTNLTTSGDEAIITGNFVKNNITYNVGYQSSNLSFFYKPLYYQNNVPVALTGFTTAQDVRLYGIFVK